MKTFNDTQKFRQWWLWIIIFIMPLVIITLTYFEENRFNNEILLPVILFIPFIWFFYVLKLKTAIDDKGISLSFRPFLLKHKFIKYEDILDAKMIMYKPIIECGGWGLRWYKNGTAYTVSGKQGIEIILKNNTIILIGTQKPEEFIKFFKNFI
jgi:hypothetical protein